MVLCGDVDSDEPEGMSEFESVLETVFVVSVCGVVDAVDPEAGIKDVFWLFAVFTAVPVVAPHLIAGLMVPSPW